jgi:hypothetical protein
VKLNGRVRLFFSSSCRVLHIYYSSVTRRIRNTATYAQLTYLSLIQYKISALSYTIQSHLMTACLYVRLYLPLGCSCTSKSYCRAARTSAFGTWCCWCSVCDYSSCTSTLRERERERKREGEEERGRGTKRVRERQTQGDSETERDSESENHRSKDADRWTQVRRAV